MLRDVGSAVATLPFGACFLGRRPGNATLNER